MGYKTGYIKPEHKSRSRDKQARIFRHMAKDAPDRKILYVDRDELVKNLEFPGWFKKTLDNWHRLMVIKHEDKALEIVNYQDYDIDFNRMRFVSEARTLDIRKTHTHEA